jgi:hypothetical protein
MEQLGMGRFQFLIRIAAGCCLCMAVDSNLVLGRNPSRCGQLLMNESDHLLFPLGNYGRLRVGQSLQSKPETKYHHASKKTACVLAVPQTFAELTASVVATRGRVIFVPSTLDLARGEGLWESLAPAMKQILNTKGGTDTAKLTVVVLSDDHDTLQAAKLRLMNAVEFIIANLAIPES